MRRIATGTLALAVLAAAPGVRSRQAGPQWTTDFSWERSDLVSRGENPFFSLQPGYSLLLADKTDTLRITVLGETRTVDGVETRVVEEREWSHAQLVEVSRNYYAISRRTNSVYYFGEDVDMYSGGKITSHEGSWLAGVQGARFGLMMPGVPLLGARYAQEVAPGLAMDRAEIMSVTDTVITPAGRYTGVLRTVETSPLEPGAGEPKVYARGVGLLQDGSLKLIRWGSLDPPAH